MKNLLNYLIILSTTLTLTGCNEEIAEEIKNATELQQDSSNIDYTTKAIRLVHKMDSNDSYIMHKSGSLSEACELTAPVGGFDADDYDYTSATYAADCILDAQELDIYAKGIKFEAQIDDNLCEYVLYQPFSFFRYQPGNSNRTYYETICDESCKTVDPSRCNKIFDSYTSVGNVYSDELAEEPKCTFDYTDANSSFPRPDCDEGTMTKISHSFTGTADDPSTPANELSCDFSTPDVNTTEIECTGDHLNCIDGAAKEDEEDYRFGVIYPNEDLNSFTKEYSYTAPIENLTSYGSNMKLANYSRVCADNSVAKTSTSVYNSLTFKGHHFETLYSNDTRSTYDATAEATYVANTPFISSYNVKPYYAIYCLDQAKDIKAQLRLFVREWDKSYLETNPYLNLVSDIQVGAAAQMDTFNLEQSPGFKWNNYRDWDDFYIDPDRNDTVDTYLWQNNQCSSVTTDFASSNFPGDNL